MKKTISTIIISIFIITLSQSQPFIIQGHIKDSLFNSIPYCSISIHKKAKGTFSDINGDFTLEVKQLPVTLEISNIGFKNKSIAVNSVTNKLQVTLVEKIYKLEKVVISTEKNKPIFIGSPKRLKGSYGFTAQKAFEQLGLMIINDNFSLYPKSFLKSISIKIVSHFFGGEKTNGKNQLRLRLYEIINNKVGKDILQENVFAIPKKSGWYKIDLPNPIKMPQNGIVVAMEWIENQPINVWGKKPNMVSYGLHLKGHLINKSDKKYYSTWGFNPIKQIWVWLELKGEEEGTYVIPAFRIELLEDE